MKSGLLGTSHKRASLEDMESVYINKDLQQVLIQDKESLNIDQVVVLATCNRLEIYFSSPDLQAAFEALYVWISDHKNIPLGRVKERLFARTNTDMMMHLFSVVGGIESMVLGENEILTQVKDAYTFFKERGATSSEFNKCFQSAIASGKRVRTETNISKGTYSVSSIAIEAIRERMLDYFGRKILIVGLGIMGRRALRKLLSLGHPDLTITNRTDEKAKRFSKEEGINFIPYMSCFDNAHHYDIILTAVSSKTHILGREQFDRDDSITELVIDLGMPRNVDASVDDCDNMELVAVDGLKDIAEKNVKSRADELGKVRAIIVEDIEKFNQWYAGKLKACS